MKRIENSAEPLESSRHDRIREEVNSNAAVFQQPEMFADLLSRHCPGVYRFRPLLEAFIVFLVVMIATFTTVTFIYQRALEAQKQEIRQGLLRTANVIATTVDLDTHRNWNDPRKESDPIFIAQEQVLIRAGRADAKIASLYTAILDGDTVRLVLDSTPPPAPGQEDERVALLHAYEDAPQAIVIALREQTLQSSEEPYTDQWGTFVSAFVPLVDAQGHFHGVLGLDLDASDYFKRLEPIKRATKRALVTCFFIAFVSAAAVWFLRRFIQILNLRRNALYADVKALGERLSEGAE